MKLNSSDIEDIKKINNKIEVLREALKNIYPNMKSYDYIKAEIDLLIKSIDEIVLETYEYKYVLDEYTEKQDPFEIEPFL